MAQIPIIQLENVDYTYQEGTPFQFKALEGINLSIGEGELTGIIGPTGSGKSTLIQHLNGLIKPSSGRVLVDGQDINAGKARRKKGKKGEEGEKPVCFKVGLVFQYPEYQLFEETVYGDVAFGPRNMGLEEKEIEERIRNAFLWLGLDFDRYHDRSPFSLSGGEMRRVALAGILAMEPKALVLDEPVAGLDPRGRRDLLNRIAQLREEKKMTVVMVSHEMGDVARISDHLIVMNKGKIAADGTPKEIFGKREWLEDLGLGLPPIMELMIKMKRAGFAVSDEIMDPDRAKEELLKLHSVLA